jgi:DNA polymerase III subunit beta
MKFEVSSESLLKALQSISGVIAPNNTLPILECFLFELESKSLTVSASDLQTVMQTTIECDSSDSGSIAISNRHVLELLKNLPDQVLTFEIDLEKFAIVITYFGGEVSIVGFNGSEYPKISEIEGATGIGLTGGILIDGINKTVFATGTDELRPVMTGVFCKLNPEGLVFASTDGNQLAVYKRSDITAPDETTFILPKKPLNILKTTISATEVVSIFFNKVNVSFEFGQTKLFCRLIDGKYPNYNSIIPKESPNRLIVNRMALLTALKRVSIFSSKETGKIKFSLAGQDFVVSTEDKDFNTGSKERVNASYDGSDLIIGFGVKYLIGMISNLESLDVEIRTSESQRAATISPVKTETDIPTEEIIFLAMPMRI